MAPINDNNIVVEVPKDAKDFVIDMGYLIFKQPNYKNWVTDDILANPVSLGKYLETHSADDDYKTNGTPLPPGSWSIYATGDTIIEEQAAGLVEKDGNGFRVYDEPPGWKYFNLLSSFESLLRSKGLDPEKYNYVIIRRT